MYGNTVRPCLRLRCVGLMLFLFFVKNIAYASENASLLTASKMSEKQLFSYVMKITLADFVADEAKNQNFQFTPEELELSRNAWDQLLTKRGVKADQYVLQMLNYYLGESTDSNVITSLQCRRSRVLVELQRIQKRGVQCDSKYQKLCADKELWEIRVADINKILSNKNEVHQKYCTTEFHSPAVMREPKKHK